jgi:hypothetical protein
LQLGPQNRQQDPLDAEFIGESVGTPIGPPDSLGDDGHQDAIALVTPGITDRVGVDLRHQFIEPCAVLRRKLIEAPRSAAQLAEFFLEPAQLRVFS